jgi:hypothetical protein
MFSQVSTHRLEKFLELPETCRAIPASSDSDHEPEEETAVLEVAAVSETYSEVFNNLVTFLFYLSFVFSRL